jgi:hypothetical protein
MSTLLQIRKPIQYDKDVVCRYIKKETNEIKLQPVVDLMEELQKHNIPIDKVIKVNHLIYE